MDHRPPAPPRAPPGACPLEAEREEVAARRPCPRRHHQWAVASKGCSGRGGPAAAHGGYGGGSEAIQRLGNRRVRAEATLRQVPAPRRAAPTVLAAARTPIIVVVAVVVVAIFPPPRDLVESEDGGRPFKSSDAARLGRLGSSGAPRPAWEGTGKRRQGKRGQRHGDRDTRQQDSLKTKKGIKRESGNGNREQGTENREQRPWYTWGKAVVFQGCV